MRARNIHNEKGSRAITDRDLSFTGMAFFLVLFLVLTLGGCGGNNRVEGTEFTLYHLNKAQTGLLPRTVSISGNAADTHEVLVGLLKALTDSENTVESRSPLKMGFSIREYRVEEGQLTLQVDEAYKELEPSVEVLVRAAIVRTLIQTPGIDGISMLVGEESLTDQTGRKVGVMNDATFVDNKAANMQAYEQASLRLYFADEGGTALREVSKTVLYNPNVPMERLVVDQLIAGPGGMAAYAVMPQDVKVLSVSVKDGACYVNLSQEFNKTMSGVTPEVTIYAIVNSLAELPDIHRVQFMINGESKVLFRDKMSLENSFTRNLDLVNPVQ